MVCATVAAALFAMPGCTRVVSGVAVQGGAGTQSTACKQVSAPLTSINPHAASEPRLRIPQPPGWRRTSMLDSEIIRFTMGNKDLIANNFVPTAVVTLESAPGVNEDQQKIFDQERAGLVDHLGATDVHTTDTTLCGHQAVIVSYDAPAMGRTLPRKAKTLIVIGAFSRNTYVATVTVQSTDPDNQTYSRDTQTILTGFQMLPPDTG
jgi:hypothetical protein